MTVPAPRPPANAPVPRTRRRDGVAPPAAVTAFQAAALPARPGTAPHARTGTAPHARTGTARNEPGHGAADRGGE
ncbi:hypothetical protein FHS32_000324 [Streptomyces albaduncus]|uniref:Uncharacterized protein n=1 Tax=Streptomyces griseoloalbus TaxID=67303 RepID=A0A7W8BIL9_9ACTN|nr:hypothetical protein [Streptomyces albaduncus]GGW40234.1 hypothetical protein GCM10010340_17520 [Streptomyces albaduncus]